MAKTERIYASATLNGDDVEHAIGSFSIALHALRAEGVMQKREVLFDTLEAEIESNEDTIVQYRTERTVIVSKSITVSAEAVRLDG